MPKNPYVPPQFDAFAQSPEAQFRVSPADGVAPEGFFCSSNLPTYVKFGGAWVMPKNPRMDGCFVIRDSNQLVTVEPRNLKKNEHVVCAENENGAEGVLVHSTGFDGSKRLNESFQFMGSRVSREKPVDYEAIADALIDERKHRGYLAWVLGPAVVHSRARHDVVWLIENDFVQCVLAGNAVAVHDIEAALYGTTLGMLQDGSAAPMGHTLHMRAINKIRALGGIAQAVNAGVVTNGIMHALVKKKIPYVLAGSLRDDGPLPEVVTDNLKAQDETRIHTAKATGAVMIASALHSIAVGNQLPSFHTHRHNEVREMLTVCVDQTEFVVSKLKDRGTHQAYGVVTNAQDFVQVLRMRLEARH